MSHTSGRKNQKGFAVVEAILFIVILAIAGGTGYFVYHSNKTTSATLANASKDANSSPTKIADKQSQSTGSDASDPTAGWATYNSQAGFSFKYPVAGWTIRGSRNPGVTTVTGVAQLNGAEYELILTENDGVGLSSKANNEYTIVVGIDPDVRSTAAYYGNTTPDEGSAINLTNGLQALQIKNNGADTANCSNSPVLFLIQSNNLYKTLSSGKYLTYTAGFCWGFKATTELSYTQQANSSESSIAKNILSSFKFQN